MPKQIDYIQQLVKSFNWHSPSWDLFILLFWAVASVIYTFASGRGRVLSVLMSVYIGKLMVIEAPFLVNLVHKYLPPAAAGFEKLIVFGVMFGLILLFLSKYAFKTSVDHKAVTGFIFSLIFSVLQVGLLINIVLLFLPLNLQDRLTPLITYVFLQPNASFVWLILPVLFLIVAGRHVSERNDL